MTDPEVAAPASNLAPKSSSCLKYVSLMSLTIQNVLDAVTVRHSRTRTADLYFNSSAIVVIEGLKLLFSFALMICEEKSFHGAFRSVTLPFCGSMKGTAQVTLIAAVYVVQNNLALIAASHLDVATYQVTYQLKLLTTALFSVVILRQKLLPTQWFSLVMLMTGVIDVKMANLSPNQKNTGEVLINQNPVLGFSAVVFACILSGFACVYFEKALKSSNSSLWLWNIQLSLVSIPLSLVFSLAKDWSAIIEKGFFFGYDHFVILVLLSKSVGGLLIAMVIKYADNIDKGFSISIALVLVCVVNSYFFGVDLNEKFVVGAMLVVSAVFLYAHYPPEDQVK